MTFRFQPVLTISTAIALALLVGLGVWQLERKVWKEALIAKVEARAHGAAMSYDDALARVEAGQDLEYQRVTLHGRYDNAHEARVFGTYEGTPGFYVFTPLLRDGEPSVYVNRGFVPQELAEPALRPDGEIENTVTVEGLLRLPEQSTALEKLFTPADRPADDVWFHRNPTAFAANAGVAAAPLYVGSSGAENPAAWPKGGVTRISFYNKHLEYALTWFGLAAALLGIYLIKSFGRD